MTPTVSVHDFWVTVVILQLCKYVIGVFAAEVAEAGLDPHDLPGEPRPVGTLKLHVDGLGLVGDAAAVIGADTTVFGPVLLLADTARDGEVDGLFLSVDVKALLPWLREGRGPKTGDVEN